VKRVRRALGIGVVLTACGQTLHVGRNTAQVTLVGSSNNIVVAQDGFGSDVSVMLSGDAMGNTGGDSAALGGPRSDNWPMDFKAVLNHKAGEPLGTISFTASARTQPTTESIPITLTIQNSDTGVSTDVPFDVTIAIAAAVSGDPVGRLQEFVSTSLQPAPFQQWIPDPAALAQLTQQPIHIQVYSPVWTGNSETDSSWDFSQLDQFVVPLVNRGEQVLLEIHTPPNLLDHLSGNNYVWDDGGRGAFATYCAKIVEHYNGDDGDGGAQNPGKTIRWWSLLGDYNNTHFTSDYVRIFNDAAAAMRGVDPTIQFAALEFSDDVNRAQGSTTPQSYLPAFIQPADAGGVDTGVGSFAVHMYATTSSQDDDSKVLQTAPKFAQHVQSLLQQIRDSGRPELVDAAVWVTQSNVNSSFAVVVDGVPVSNNDQTTPFQLDSRGTGAFFAAWQPFMFSQLGQSGNGALFHWEYTAGHDQGDSSLGLDKQNAEVNYDDNTKYLSYWVDYWLGRMFPVPPGQDILPVKTTEAPSASTLPDVDVLATRNDADGSFVAMVTDLAVGQPIAGAGLARTVVVDVSGVPSLKSAAHLSASSLTIDARTDTATGPQPRTLPETVPPSLRYPLDLAGYGVAFLKLVPQ
jgi:hypothetical protein